jgi:hypothetical protein
MNKATEMTKTVNQLGARYAKDAINAMAKELSQDPAYETWEYSALKELAAKKIAHQIGLAYN